eukprot:Unigene3717_Nuclearia_a/m.11344 Unigene3717_Nuclearia_a/g.11344  ORF Unigene3717_Nuclearia_a/g.11344 Unigene3717_Nuclearia_a/m.11344 type:complete len:326 (-) Unigene3717_Nuclearia_a:1431-2408(-)
MPPAVKLPESDSGGTCAEPLAFGATRGDAFGVVAGELLAELASLRPVSIACWRSCSSASLTLAGLGSVVLPLFASRVKRFCRRCSNSSRPSLMIEPTSSAMTGRPLAVRPDEAWLGFFCVTMSSLATKSSSTSDVSSARCAPISSGACSFASSRSSSNLKSKSPSSALSVAGAGLRVAGAGRPALEALLALLRRCCAPLCHSFATVAAPALASPVARDRPSFTPAPLASPGPVFRPSFFSTSRTSVALGAGAGFSAEPALALALAAFRFGIGGSCISHLSQSTRLRIRSPDISTSVLSFTASLICSTSDVSARTRLKLASTARCT